jgi:APA family basic amino acid/polyamine antiporter
MAKSLENAPVFLLVWVLAGVLTFFGALSLCELTGQIPKTGGLYTYFEEVYGEKLGFLYGWANLVIAGSGAIAAISFIFANYVGEFFPLPHFSPALEQWPVTLPYLGKIFPLADIGSKSVGGILVIFLTWLNIRGIRLGATLQSISTSSKVIAIAAIVVVAFIAGSKIGNSANFFSSTAKGAALTGWSMITAIGIAIGGAFWSYDGWANVAFIGGEVKDPAKTIPKALILGCLTFIGLYLVVNLAYLYILPVDAIGKVPDERVASTMVSTVLGKTGGIAIALLIILSTFDIVNASILTNSRVYLAMAEKGVFWKKTAAIHPKFNTPHVALIIQGVWSLVLLFSGSFKVISDMYVFVNWILYVLMAVAVFVLRFRFPNQHRPFKVPAYPWVPAIFLIFSTAYVVLTLVTDIKAYQAGEQPIIQSLTGIVLVLIGFPFLYYWKKRYAVK